jgi:hypothetical protein
MPGGWGPTGDGGLSPAGWGESPGNTHCPLLQGFDTDRRGSFLMSALRATLHCGSRVSGSFGHVLDYQHRRLVGVIVSGRDHAQRPVREADRVAGLQLGTALSSLGGSAAAPSTVSSLKRDPAIGFRETHSRRGQRSRNRASRSGRSARRVSPRSAELAPVGRPCRRWR